MKARRHHADHLIWTPAQLNRASDNRGIASESPVPQSVLEHHHALVPGGRVLLDEPAAERGLHVHSGEERRGHPRAAQLRRITGARQADARARVRGKLFEAAALSSPVCERQIRRNVLVEALARVVDPDHHQPLGMRVWKRPEKHAVHDAEDRSVGSYT